MQLRDTFELKCKVCGHKWEYTGKKHRTRCPNRKCRKWVKTGHYTIGTHRKKIDQSKTDKREGRQLSINAIMEREHYMAIITITHYFDRGEGITRPQYRWALIKDHNRIEKTSTFGRKKDFDNFFKQDRFGNKGDLRRIISSDNNLGNFLRRLVDYQILERFEDKKHVERFKLRKDAMLLLKHSFLHEMVDFYSECCGDIDGLYDLVANYSRENWDTFIEVNESPLSAKLRIKRGNWLVA